MMFLIMARQAAPVGGVAASAFATVVMPVTLVLLAAIALGCHRPEVRSSMRSLLERLCIAGIIGCGAIVLAQGLVLGRVPAISTVVIAVFGGCVVVMAAHFAGRRTFLARSNLQQRILVLGCGRKAGSIFRRLQGNDLDVELAGFVGETGGTSCREREANAREQNAATITADMIVPMPQYLHTYALSRGINEIVVAWDDEKAQAPMEQLIACRLGGIAVTDSGAFIERETRRVDVEDFEPSWLVFSHGFGRGRVRAAVKRCEDLIIGSALLLLFAPLMPIIALSIKLDTPGPVFYRQERIGLGGRRFWILKFRSMRCDAEGDGQPRWAEANDSRVTFVGRFLRAARLDELPQLINVLRGEMSLVGPRPERPAFAAELAQQITFYNERHSCKPGLTGWAQINYSYGASVADAREKLKYELYYLKNWSLFLDFLILLETARILLFREGAR